MNASTVIWILRINGINFQLSTSKIYAPFQFVIIDMAKNWVASPFKNFPKFFFEKIFRYGFQFDQEGSSQIPHQRSKSQRKEKGPHWIFRIMFCLEMLPGNPENRDSREISWKVGTYFPGNFWKNSREVGKLNYFTSLCSKMDKKFKWHF